MNNKFDELTKSLAQSVTRRGALKRFGLVSLALASLTAVNCAGADAVTDCNAHVEQALKTAAVNPGIHSRFSCNVGEAVGLPIADYVLDNFLIPLDTEDEQ